MYGGIKIWELEIVLAVVIMVFFGFSQYHLSNSKLRIRRRYSERFFGLISGIFTVVFIILLFKESSDLLLKFGYSTLSSGDSEFYAVTSAVFAGMCISAIFFALSYYIGKIAGYAKRGYLLDKIVPSREPAINAG